MFRTMFSAVFLRFDWINAIHRDRRHDFRGFTFANQQMADADFHYLFQQEINQRAAIEPDAQHHLQGGMVYGPPAAFCRES